MLSHSVVPDSCNPMNYSPPGSSVHGIFSRQEYWSALPFLPPGDLPYSGIEPTCPALQAYSLLLSQWGCSGERERNQQRILSKRSKSWRMWCAGSWGEKIFKEWRHDETLSAVVCKSSKMRTENWPLDFNCGLGISDFDKSSFNEVMEHSEYTHCLRKFIIMKRWRMGW